MADLIGIVHGGKPKRSARTGLQSLISSGPFTGSGTTATAVPRRACCAMEMAGKYLTRMYRTNPDFVFTVTGDFVRKCQTFLRAHRPASI
jgi:hypothetical protein